MVNNSLKEYFKGIKLKFQARNDLTMAQLLCGETFSLDASRKSKLKLKFHKEILFHNRGINILIRNHPHEWKQQSSQQHQKDFFSQVTFWVSSINEGQFCCGFVKCHTRCFSETKFHNCER